MRPLAAIEPLVNDGSVVSRVITVEASATAVGPVPLDALVAPFAAKRGRTVPWPHPETVTVRVVDEVSVPGLKVQPVAVPALVKSLAATPVTASENVSA